MIGAAMIALHLLRHAHAGDARPAGRATTTRRPLSEKGDRQAERLGTLLATFDVTPDLFITSPRLRAEPDGGDRAEALGARWSWTSASRNRSTPVS